MKALDNKPKLLCSVYRKNSFAKFKYTIVRIILFESDDVYRVFRIVSRDDNSGESKYLGQFGYYDSAREFIDNSWEVDKDDVIFNR